MADPFDGIELEWRVAESRDRAVRAQRAVDVGAPRLPAALRRMQHDQPGGVGRWNLGDHGTIEIDSWFVPVAALGEGAPRARGWLWSPQGDVVRVDLVAVPGDDRCILSIEARPPLPSRWHAHPAELRALARVALLEIAEELRWQAGRAVPASA